MLQSDMRVIFMGTPQFAVPALQKLIEAGYELVAVVTQPDRPVGRSGRPVASPVKRVAVAHGIPVLQPESVREPSAIDTLRDLSPDLIVVAAFGQILPKALLAIPPRGFINVHAAPLPRYRGAWPIGAVILAGERETGVTIMLVEPKLDTGPILAQRTVPIGRRDTTATLSERLAQVGAELLVEVLPRWLSGEIQPVRQDEAQATYIPMISKEHGRVDWTKAAEEIDRQCRAYFPWPGCYTMFEGRLLKILEAYPLPEWQGPAKPGDVIGWQGGGLAVATGKGALIINQLQIEGRRAMGAEEFLRGQPGIIGKTLQFVEAAD